VVLGDARFDVSIANHGPLTCAFGALPIGSTATKTSTPADSVSSNDTVGCYHRWAVSAAGLLTRHSRGKDPTVLTTAALVVATLLSSAAIALPPAGADISVDFTSSSSTVLLPGAKLDLSITNHGPDPLTSATVVVQFGATAGSTWPTPCAFDTAAKTLTCTFSALPVGSTATISATVYFGVNGRPTHFFNTATRTASTPSDPNSANDTDTMRCSFSGSWFPPPPGPTLYC
jgi:hypothetical protein